MRSWKIRRQVRDSTDGSTRGQILVVFAVAAAALILVVGLVADAGNAFLNRRSGQNASDLAALAGTKVVADYYTKAPTITSADVYNAISARMTANECAVSGATPCSWTASFVDKNEVVTGTVSPTGPIPPNTQGVIVHATLTPRTYFLGAIGQGQWLVNTDATALTAKITSPAAGTLLPIAVNQPAGYTTGVEYTLTAGSSYGPGNFSWLSWNDDNSARVLEASLCTPDNPALTVPIYVPGDTGVTNSAGIRDCLDYWIASGTTILIPLFDQCDPCNGTTAQFRVIGFVAFVLTGYNTSRGAINTLTGTFVEYSSLTSVPAGGGSGPPSAGDKTVMLGLIR